MSKIKLIKKYWDNQTCNINHSKKKFLSKEYFKEVRKKRFFVEPHILDFADFKSFKNKKVLEIGCGIGTDGVEFIKHGANYTGVELSENSLNIFKKRIKILKLSHLKSNLILSSAENLKNVPKLNFDLIYSFGVIHHTPNMRKAFNEIYKISNKKTKIKIMLYAKNSYKNYMLDLTNYRYEAQKGCPVVYKVDKNDLYKLINNKFKIIELNKILFFPIKLNPTKKIFIKKLNILIVCQQKFLINCPKKLGNTC